MYILRLCVAIFSLLLPVTSAWAQAEVNLGGMLLDAQRYTVKVRGTVVWPFSPEQAGTGQGTGFIIDRQKGWIVTNAHVAKRSPATVEIAVGDNDTDWIGVTRLYVDNYLDIAVLKVDVAKLPADTASAKLGCDKTVKQGVTVVAYGHPINLTFTATRGIVSSVRTLGNQEFVQMDANINPGNSGGPLLSVDAAEVIGVNTANFPGAPGLGLATSIRHVCPILDLLTKGMDPSVPTIPVYWLKQGRIERLIVAAPFPRSGASSDDGLKSGDVVQGIAGGPKLVGLPDLHTALRGIQGSVMLSVMRNGNVQDVKVALVPAKPPLTRRAVTFAGLMVSERINLDNGGSILPPLRVEYIRPGELAARSGFQTFDLVDSIDGRRFTSVGDLHAWLKAKPPSVKVALLVRRFSSTDPRVSAEYFRFELPPAELKLLTIDD